jgi:hypothetical protein
MHREGGWKSRNKRDQGAREIRKDGGGKVKEMKEDTPYTLDCCSVMTHYCNSLWRDNVHTAGLDLKMLAYENLTDLSQCRNRGYVL